MSEKLSVRELLAIIEAGGEQRQDDQAAQEILRRGSSVVPELIEAAAGSADYPHLSRCVGFLFGTASPQDLDRALQSLLVGVPDLEVRKRVAQLAEDMKRVRGRAKQGKRRRG